MDTAVGISHEQHKMDKSIYDEFVFEPSWNDLIAAGILHKNHDARFDRLVRGLIHVVGEVRYDAQIEDLKFKEVI